MARPGVSYNEVYQAIHFLLEQNKQPTIEAVRQYLKTGSNSTLSTHLRAWKASQSEDPNLMNNEKIPKELMGTITKLWQRLMNQANIKIEDVQQAARERLSKMNEDYNFLQHTQTALQQKQQESEKQKEILSQKNTRLSQQLTEASLEIAMLREKYARTVEQYKDAQHYFEEVKRQNQQAQSNLEHFRAESLKQRIAEQEQYKAYVNQLEQDLQKKDRLLANIQQEQLETQQWAQQIAFESKSFQAQLKKMEAQYAAMVKRLDETTQELNKKSIESKYYQTHYQELSKREEKQAQLLAHTNVEISATIKELTLVKAEFQKINEENKFLTQQNWLLKQEKEQMCKKFESINIHNKNKRT